MNYSLGANLTLVIHLAFIVFVVFGALLLFQSKKFAFIHIPCVVYGAYMEFSHSVCPLTYVENWFLRMADMKNYSNSFIEHYLISIIYPNNLTPELQFYLGCFLIFTNIIIYTLVIKSLR